MTAQIDGARELLRQAVAVLDSEIKVPAAQRTRCAGHLGRQALEMLVAQACAGLGAAMPRATMRSQLIALGALADTELSRRARTAWDGLSRSCHRHAYELPPDDKEIRFLLSETLAMIHQISTRTT